MGRPCPLRLPPFRIVDEEAIRAHPAFREMMDQLARQMEHLDPSVAPNRLELLRAQLQQMLRDGTEYRDWIVAFLERLDKQDLLRAPLERLDQLQRERVKRTISTRLRQ
jgi:alpha-glucuronidase